MSSTSRTIDLARSGLCFAVLVALVPLAYWPTYLSKIFETTDDYVHLHAATAALWALLLIVQPLLIGLRRFTLHRIIGSASYVLGPLVVISMVLLAHSKVQGRPFEAYTLILYLQLSLAAVFALSYALGILTRRRVALHARFMVCTGLTMIDPVCARVIMFWIYPVPLGKLQWITFGLTDLVLLALIWLERRRPTGRLVFPLMLVVFMVAQAPIVLATQTGAWRAFAEWFASLPLT
jgi:hypothetical protein